MGGVGVEHAGEHGDDGHVSHGWAGEHLKKVIVLFNNKKLTTSGLKFYPATPSTSSTSFIRHPLAVLWIPIPALGTVRWETGGRSRENIEIIFR